MFGPGVRTIASAVSDIPSTDAEDTGDDNEVRGMPHTLM
jgi:hypothetical protein